jgi:hypothetical protein
MTTKQLPTVEEMTVINALLDVQRTINHLLEEVKYDETATSWEQLNMKAIYSHPFHDSSVEYLATYAVRAIQAISKARTMQKAREALV